MYGNLVIYDALDLISSFPIIGEETLKLSFNVPNTDKDAPSIKQVFRVYKMDERNRDKNGRSSVYTLHFTTREQYAVLNTRVQQSYIAQSLSQMARKVYNEYIFSTTRPKPIEIEDTLGIHDIVIPNLDPFQAMHRLAKLSRSDENPSSTFLFYEDHNGFKFKTVESLLRGETKQTYYYRPAGFTQKKDDGELNDNFIISDMTQHQSFDAIKNIMNGMYSDNLLTHDIINKSYRTYGFEYQKFFDSPFAGHLNNGEKKGSKLVSDNANFTTKTSVTMMVPTELEQKDNVYVVGKNFKINPKNTELFRLQQQSSFSQLDTVVTSITIPGDHTRTVGDVITLNLPTASGVTNIEGPDRFYSGDYLVTQVRHKINIDTYNTVMQVVRESYSNPITGRTDTTKRNQNDQKLQSESLNLDV